jgi:hypothetical protein
MNPTGQELELLSPWALRTDMVMPEAQRELARNVLGAMLVALDGPGGVSRTDLSRVLEMLHEVDTRPLDIADTDTSLTHAEVAAYNRYFAIRHVDSESPAITLLQGLLTMLQRFTGLCGELDPLDREAFELQVAGVREHVQLLARTLNLEPFPT